MLGNRKLQTTFTNLVGNTRIKAVKEGKLRRTICPRCQAVDSWEHCLTCYEVAMDGMVGGKQWLDNIKGVMKEIATDAPATYKASEVENARVYRQPVRRLQE